MKTIVTIIMKKQFKICFIILILCISIHKASAQTSSVLTTNNLSEIYNWNKYPSYPVYLEFMSYYSEHYPDLCTIDTIGLSTEGRLILSMHISLQKNKELTQPRVFFSSAIHGNELTGSMVLMHLIDTICQNPQDFDLYLNNIQLYICPFANPDGTWSANEQDVSLSMRYNANYKDLNRDYPEVFSQNQSNISQRQLETQHFIAYQNKKLFTLSANLHTGSEVFNFPWDKYTSFQKKHADFEWFKALGESYINQLHKFSSNNYVNTFANNGIVCGGDWYTITGGRQDWATYYAHCKEITLEMSEDYIPNANNITKYVYLHRDALKSFMDMSQIGFATTVYDSVTQEKLTDVLIEVLDYDKDSSQIYTNSQGWAIKTLLQGTYQVKFSKNGYISKTLTINTFDNLQSIDVFLTKQDNFLTPNAQKQPQISFYFNSNELIFHTDGEYSYQIVDMNAKTHYFSLSQHGKNILNTAFLPAGTYIIYLYNQNGITNSYKFITK